MLTSPTSHTVAARSSRTKSPNPSGRLRGNGTILRGRHFKPAGVSVRSPGSAGSIVPANWKTIVSGGLQDRSLDNDAVACKLPKRDEQLSRERDDGHLLAAPAIELHSLMKPAR